MNRFARAAALCLSLLLAFPAVAEEAKKAVSETVTTTTTQQRAVKTETVVTPLKPAEGSRAIHFEDFDLNHDNNLTREEAGEMLFRLYDTDGNAVIDNIEFERKAVLSISPMSKTTKMTYDDNGDGVADKQEQTEEAIMEQTMLSKFDKDADGLSPAEFTEKRFSEVDVNKSHVIEKREWLGVYDPRVNAQNQADAALNK
jgi:hypothetical protein